MKVKKETHSAIYFGISLKNKKGKIIQTLKSKTLLQSNVLPLTEALGYEWAQLTAGLL